MPELLFSDYDHENERHAEITLHEDFSVSVERRVETNSDYLKPGAELPADWSDSQELRFDSAAEACCFVEMLSDVLLDRCFAYFDDGDEVDDSDDAREAIAAMLDDYAPGRDDLVDTAAKAHCKTKADALAAYPR